MAGAESLFAAGSAVPACYFLDLLVQFWEDHFRMSVVAGGLKEFGQAGSL